jgi:hypothetical protein
MSDDLREWYKKHGICPQCGQREGFNGGVLCFECRAKNQQNNIKYQSDPERVRRYNQHENAQKKKQYYERKAAGLCTCCGKRGQEKGLLCFSCWRKRQRRREKDKADKLRRGMHFKDRKERGVCMYCEKPTIPGKCFCEEHLKQRQQVFEKCKDKMSERWRDEIRNDWELAKALHKKRAGENNEM